MSRSVHASGSPVARRAAAVFVCATLVGAASVVARQAPSAGASSGQEAAGDAAAKRPAPYTVRGGHRDGPSFFPRIDYPQLKPLVADEIDFQHYHTYEETVGLLRGWAERHPDLVDLYSAGQSLEGRELWQVTLTNKQTGAHTDKPGFFIEGGRHAGEISGVEATLYFINHVLTRYATDPEIRALVDTKALYARPHNNPDGASLYHYTAQTLRSTVRPHDNDGDGLVDEDPGEDLDGDGFIRQMRKFVGEGKGAFIKDPKDGQGRAMRRVGEGKGDWEVYPEGIDNDGDGRYNEDGVGGLDLHRNYPENWRPMKEATGRGHTQLGAGEFPLSEPETRAVFTFLLTHPNIAIVQSLDTAVPMLLRGPSTSRSEESMFPEDLALFRQYDAKGLEITGYPWAGDVYEVYATRLRTNPVTGEPLRPTPLFGHGPDFGYFSYGTIWYGNEIWNGGRFVDYDEDGRIDEWEVLRWHDEHRAGKDDFLPWAPFAHPQLGEVEIGGFNPKFYLQNPPPDLLEAWARNEALFNLHLAQQLPQVKIVEARVAAGADAGTSVVEMTVTNTGQMPTALEMAKRVKMVKPDTASIELEKGQELTPVPDGQPPQTTSVEIDWLAPGETKSVAWTVKGAGTVKVAILSTRGGVDRRELPVP